MFFFDRSVGKAVPSALRLVGVPVEIHDELYPQRSVPDEEWIKEATHRGSVLLTRDRRIRRRPAELKAVSRAGARMFVLRGKEVKRLDMLRALMVAWEKMQTVIETETSSSWIYEINSSGQMKKLHPS